MAIQVGRHIEMAGQAIYLDWLLSDRDQQRGMHAGKRLRLKHKRLKNVGQFKVRLAS